MKTDEQRTVIGLPHEAPIMIDDDYLTEMTERLRKLRALVGAREEREAKNRATFKKRGISTMM